MENICILPRGLEFIKQENQEGKINVQGYFNNLEMAD
jgi:hypothetical protein